MTKTLLLADGSVTIQRVIELTFAHEDVRVTSVSDGRRAQQILGAERPDVILIDVDLPEVDGYDLAAHIRRNPRLKDIPVLLLASAFEPVDSERARSVGCDGVITKPFEPQVVVTRVKELLDQAEHKAAPGPAPTDYDPGRTSAAPAFPRAVEAPAAVAEPTFRRPAPPPDAPAIAAGQAVVPETLELPTHPIWQPPPSPLGPGAALVQPPAPPLSVTAPPAMPAPPPAPKVTLVSAFSALLAAEQSSQPAAPPVAQAISEASIEDAVRRVLVRMTDDLVRRIVVDTAERLIREEIENIKRNPE